ncbi:MAG: 16S rRNA (cytidine(1402)-2'-O)-methyltransferase [Candidatus Caenarcaniphilales bacterium]|nr:16S rRNA (cytidine(1402)-2'-O)-methyltransferase [Candidatus Caenarcaniphilales bacterium]
MEKLENALYVLATPIGNLGDLTFRAKDLLEKTDCIFCEDTRVSLKLLNHLGIQKRVLSCNAHNEWKKVDEINRLLLEGASVAYLSDAGTPGISDPGNLLVSGVQKAGFKVIPIPGPSSIAAILSVCGFNLSDGFYFAGFLPRTEGKLKKLIYSFLVEQNLPVVSFEAPYRIRKTLDLITSVCPEADICLGRELTKLYEQILYGKVVEISSQKWPEKGEFVFVLDLDKKIAKQSKIKLAE